MVATACSTEGTKITLDGGRILTLSDPFKQCCVFPDSSSTPYLICLIFVKKSGLYYYVSCMALLNSIYRAKQTTHGDGTRYLWKRSHPCYGYFPTTDTIFKTNEVMDQKCDELSNTFQLPCI